jgi:hypothetical protein
MAVATTVVKGAETRQRGPRAESMEEGVDAERQRGGGAESRPRGRGGREGVVIGLLRRRGRKMWGMGSYIVSSNGPVPICK